MGFLRFRFLTSLLVETEWQPGQSGAQASEKESAAKPAHTTPARARSRTPR